jgi:hypothetical protein
VYYRYLPSFKPPEDLSGESTTIDDKDKDVDVQVL